MHELSIAMSIVELAVEEASKNNATVIQKVDVEIGTLSGVETEALQFAWDVAIQGTGAKDSILEIHVIPAEARCLQCGTSFPAGNFFVQCPECKGYRYEIIKGKELKIRSLLVE